MGVIGPITTALLCSWVCALLLVLLIQDVEKAPILGRRSSLSAGLHPPSSSSSLADVQRSPSSPSGPILAASHVIFPLQAHSFHRTQAIILEPSALTHAPDPPHPRTLRTSPQSTYSAITTATMMPASFMTATLSPWRAIRPRRDAEPLSCVEREEKSSFCGLGRGG